MHFGNAERYINSLLSVGESFRLNGECFTIVDCGKPTCKSGEPKTDIYVGAKSNSGQYIELKISFKKENADFLENKTTAKRAEQLFGSIWMDVVINSTLSIKRHFIERPLIYKNSYGKTSKGSITLGWKFELVNKPGGNLSGKMLLTEEQIIDIYAGTNLDYDKRNAYIGAQKVQDSGIANYVLNIDYVNSTQDVINNLIPIEKYIKKYHNIYFACKALNYRSFERKYDGDRPLAVFIDWYVCKDKLAHKYVFDEPLVTKGNKVSKSLLDSMRSLKIKTTDDINNQNINDPSIIYSG